jgi:hypothetical protein
MTLVQQGLRWPHCLWASQSPFPGPLHSSHSDLLASRSLLPLAFLASLTFFGLPSWWPSRGLRHSLPVLPIHSGLGHFLHSLGSSVSKETSNSKPRTLPCSPGPSIHLLWKEAVSYRVSRSHSRPSLLSSSALLFPFHRARWLPLDRLGASFLVFLLWLGSESSPYRTFSAGWMSQGTLRLLLQWMHLCLSWACLLQGLCSQKAKCLLPSDFIGNTEPWSLLPAHLWKRTKVA